jgi:hypothetical protein
MVLIPSDYFTRRSLAIRFYALTVRQRLALTAPPRPPQ